ncbi:MAG: glycosyltransferase [Bacilli bacterium]|nr:glycosyltransferase [Bacilli bacterium]
MNQNGFDCLFYSQHNSSLGNCQSSNLKSFYPQSKDIIIVSGLSLKSFRDLYNLKKLAQAKLERKNRFSFSQRCLNRLKVIQNLANLKWYNIPKIFFEKMFPQRRLKDFLLVLSLPNKPILASEVNNSKLYDKVHFASKNENDFDNQGKFFYCPLPNNRTENKASILSILKQELNLQEKSNITVVMNGYKRGKNLTRQLEAIKKQTIQPDSIMLWYNYPGKQETVNDFVIQQTKAAVSNENWGVWARFYFSLNAKTKYICIFDDDTIPGSKWLENCLNTSKSHRGLLGTIGLIFDSPDDYFQHTRYGWANPNDQVKQVDIVGHSWFFEKEFLTAYCRELPLLDVRLCGEDIHFSYTIQKYFGLNTYVPPHPKSDRELWGSLDGFDLGCDKNAISRANPTNAEVFSIGVNDYFKKCFKAGWKLINFNKN